MKKHWDILPAPDPGVVRLLREQLGVEERIANLMALRGLKSYDEAKHFFSPQWTDLHSPWLMKDMEIAADRIMKAMQDGERILVFGDYDVDGTTSVATMYSFLEKIYPGHIHFYIPDRYSEGYGISKQGILFAEENKCELIIALDCGIKAFEEVNFAAEKGIDFIICDHHLPEKELPAAVAILNPKRSDCTYPYDELTGCGIGFKLISAIAEQMDMPFEAIQPFLEWVAISTCCDIVPITGENRVLVHFGLEQLNNDPGKAIYTLIEKAGKKLPFTVSDVVFTLGPRINAAGRIEHGKLAVEMLLSDSESAALETAAIIEERNAERRDLDRSITEEALEMIEHKELKNRKSTVLYREGWSKGVIGIVASRLIENYHRPTVVLTGVDGKAVGSARSVSGFDIHSALEECSPFLEQFGGHAFAAGMTLNVEKVEGFAKRFEEVVSERISEDQLRPIITVEMELDLADITDKFFRILKRFSPFGPKNLNPVFVARNVVDTGYSKAVGEFGDHLKLYVYQPHHRSIRFGGIGFGLGKWHERISSKKPFDMAFCLEENHWQGQTSIQLQVLDIKMA
ncbi:single-stranded-DNA-specific exonuclease RecJ [bacterium SCSIO 12741]|nr:single-stranded-DNA-specific exonuclease RecJ [bacterium SCSIO 12741]